MMVWEAYKKVKSNKGSAGVDQQTLDDFDKNCSKELYKMLMILSLIVVRFRKQTNYLQV